MRNMRQKGSDGLAAEKTPREIQPDHQKKKTPQPAMGYFNFGEKS